LGAQFGGGFHRARDRVGNIVEFEIEKNFRPGRANGTEDLRTFGREELQADFEKRDLVAQLLNQSQRFF